MMNEILTSLRILLEQHQCTHLLLDDPIHILYLTQVPLSAGRLLISMDKTTLFVDPRYKEKAEQRFQGQTVSGKNVDSLLKETLSQENEASIAFLSDKVTFDRWSSWQNFQLPSIRFIPTPHLLDPLRAIKNRTEISSIEQACQITYQSYLFLKNQLKAGVTEIELSQALQIHLLELGADCPAFPPIIAFGTNSSMPHHTPTHRPLKLHEIVQFDIGCKKNNYCSDLSRIHFFGQPHKKLLEIHSIVLQAKQAAEKIATPGTLLTTLDLTARAIINDAGYQNDFPHSLGHGLGLEIHEYPLIKETSQNLTLKEGMVITLEPGIYLEGLGGIRLEDTYLITSTSPLNLTQGAENALV